MAAASLVREGRTVVLAGVPEAIALPAVEALVRWDPGWLAARELADRRELGLPPAARVAELTGSRRALEEALTQLDLPPSAQVLGPLPLPVPGGEPRPAAGARAATPAARRPDHRVLVRAPLADTSALTSSLVALKAYRSARKEAEVVTVRVDPIDMW
jgi:primosomal protein N' (replication factor Y)